MSSDNRQPEELFRALDPIDDDRLIVHRTVDRSGEPTYVFRISDADNETSMSVGITAAEIAYLAQLLAQEGSRR